MKTYTCGNQELSAQFPHQIRQYLVMSFVRGHPREDKPNWTLFDVVTKNDSNLVSLPPGHI